RTDPARRAFPTFQHNGAPGRRCRIRRTLAGMERNDDIEALLRLAACPGSQGARRLLAQATPAEALAAGPALWSACGLTPLQSARLQRPDMAMVERARAWLEVPGRHLLGWHDPDYPPLLRRGGNPPAVLFLDGDPALLWRPGVAVVGSRSPSPVGVETARELGSARKSTRLNSSHVKISYAVFCLKKKKTSQGRR